MGDYSLSFRSDYHEGRPVSSGPPVLPPPPPLPPGTVSPHLCLLCPTRPSPLAQKPVPLSPAGVSALPGMDRLRVEEWVEGDSRPDSMDGSFIRKVHSRRQPINIVEGKDNEQSNCIGEDMHELDLS